VIDFRYHLVSIVAVFLALAIGILVGATALKPTTLKVLYKTSQKLEQQINSVQASNRTLEQQIRNDQAFAASSSAVLLNHLLAGQRAVVVTAPGADSQVVNGVTTTLQQAGATVTGQVTLQQEFFVTDGNATSNLEYLAQQLATPGISLGSGQSPQPAADPQIAGQQEAAQVIADALVTRDGPGLPAAQRAAILNGFAQHSYLQVTAATGASSTTLAPATLAVVVIPASPPPGGDSYPANLALLSLAQQLQTAGKAAVVAGSQPGSGPGSAIDELSSGSSGIQVSSVDNADTEVGQIMVAQALSLELTGHKPASYGVASGVVPSPAPTPSASPSAPPVAAKPAASLARRR
jgi:hypothetical protein